MTNPYEAPKSEIGDTHHEEIAPRLWHPGAAASLSLFFTPVFGAYIHMKNWHALGEHAKAANSQNWAVASLAFFLLFPLMPLLVDSKDLEPIFRLSAIILLFTWYFICAKRQMSYIQLKFGNAYPRKGWLIPILIAIGGMAVYVALVTAGIFVIMSIS